MQELWKRAINLPSEPLICAGIGRMLAVGGAHQEWGYSLQQCEDSHRVGRGTEWKCCNLNMAPWAVKVMPEATSDTSPVQDQEGTKVA